MTFTTTSASSDVSDSAKWSGLGKTIYTSTTAGGTVTVSNSAKDYSGGATLNTMTGGTLVVNNGSSGPANAPTSGAFGTGTLTIGATNMRTGTASDITIGNAITFSGAPTFATQATEKSLIFTGNASLAASRIITVNTGSTVAGKNVEFSGAISGTLFGITKAGTGNLVLSGANTYTGVTTISAGNLSVNSIKNVGGVAISTTALGGSFVAQIGYGYFNLTGGTFKSNGGFSIGTSNAAASSAVAYVGGTGILDWSGANNQTVGYTSPASLTVGPGGSVSRGASANVT